MRRTGAEGRGLVRYGAPLPGLSLPVLPGLTSAAARPYGEPLGGGSVLLDAASAYWGCCMSARGARMRRTDAEGRGPVRFGPPSPEQGLPILPGLASAAARPHGGFSAAVPFSWMPRAAAGAAVRVPGGAHVWTGAGGRGLVRYGPPSPEQGSPCSWSREPLLGLPYDCTEVRMRRTDTEGRGPVRFGPPLPEQGLPALPGLAVAAARPHGDRPGGGPVLPDTASAYWGCRTSARRCA